MDKKYGLEFGYCGNDARTFVWFANEEDRDNALIKVEEANWQKLAIFNGLIVNLKYVCYCRKYEE